AKEVELYQNINEVTHNQVEFFNRNNNIGLQYRGDLTFKVWTELSFQDYKGADLQDEFSIAISARLRVKSKDSLEITDLETRIGPREDLNVISKNIYLSHKNHSVVTFPCRTKKLRINGNNGNIDKAEESDTNTITLFYKKASEKPLSLQAECNGRRFSLNLIDDGQSNDIYKSLSIQASSKIQRKKIIEKQYEKSLEKKLGIKIIN
ncbi:MAG: hypothetical protein HRT44_13565, partial [Bdellovibrionales bacterium]|nr:hypothetical protein [Bdellovibrionales bacterium]NQZ20267.1 hypothetical protein [Bdellovibrionales bacterium]